MMAGKWTVMFRRRLCASLISGGLYDRPGPKLLVRILIQREREWQGNVWREPTSAMVTGHHFSYHLLNDITVDKKWTCHWPLTVVNSVRLLWSKEKIVLRDEYWRYIIKAFYCRHHPICQSIIPWPVSRSVEKRGVGKYAISQHPVTLILMGHGIKAQIHTHWEIA